MEHVLEEFFVLRDSINGRMVKEDITILLNYNVFVYFVVVYL